MIFLRSNILNHSRLVTRRFNFRKVGKELNQGEGFDQYSAHSPLFLGRWGAEEQRSKIFFEHPPVPNRIAKFAFVIIFALTFNSGTRTRLKRNYKR